MVPASASNRVAAVSDLSSSPPASAPIEQALAQTQETQDKLSSGVNELAVTNAVLQQEVPVEALTGDLALALEKNEALEAKVQECVDDLGDVGKVLAAEVARRKRLEQKLADAKAELSAGNGNLDGDAGN
ncbi:MAG: hypothetical protein JWQ73_3124 [Variovorax sp.]|jgi:chromosome segregation ATPase|nr:hypothetical protein [Variovorax sp.]